MGKDQTTVVMRNRFIKGGVCFFVIIIIYMLCPTKVVSMHLDKLRCRNIDRIIHSQLGLVSCT